MTENAHVITGQDSNAKLGISDKLVTGELSDSSLGCFSEPSRNSKVESLLNLVRSLKQKVTNTWFEYPNYATWKNFSGKGHTYQSHHFFVNQKIFEWTKDCKTTKIGVASDHSAILLKLGVTYEKKTHRRTRRIAKWDELIDSDLKKDFNDARR